MSNPILAGQTILITGAARRLGAEMARTFHANGANLVVHYRSSSDAADSLVERFNTERAGSAIAAAADLMLSQSPQQLVAAAVDHFGGLSGLVNNASSFYPTPVGDITYEHWDDLVGSNLKAPLFLSQAAAPALRESGGSIVNIIDIHALRPLAQHTVYCCAKAGLSMLTRSLAKELGPQVRVNGIAPGPIMWPENGISDEEKNAIVDSTSLQRSGDPSDIAKAALYFFSAAPFVTGQILAVDGGRTLTW